MEMGSKWDAAVIRSIANGFGNSQGRSFAFANCFLPNGLLAIREHEGGEAPFPPDCLPVLPLLLEAPIGSDPSKSRIPRLPHYPIPPPDGQSANGGQIPQRFRTTGHEIRFHENIRGGCVLPHPCVCMGHDPRARTHCPAHTIWPIIRNSTQAGDAIFPMSPPCLENRAFEKVTNITIYPDGPKFSPHAFRLWAKQDIKDGGSTLSIILKSGTRTRPG